MSKARQAPDDCQWRSSEANPRVLWLVRGAAEHIGSVEPKGRQWQNRDTGEMFTYKNDAMSSVEKFL